MRIGPLISLLSSTYGMPEPTVTVVARALREAGLLTTGARGINAPEMSMRDVARLTLALMTGEPPSRVVAEFCFIAQLQTKTVFETEAWISSERLSNGHIFEDAVTEVFSAMFDDVRRDAFSTFFSAGVLVPNVEIALDTSRRVARISYPTSSAEYTNLIGYARLDELYETRPITLKVWEEIEAIESSGANSYDSTDVVPGRGMRVVRSITHKELFAVCTALRSDVAQKQETDQEV